MVNAIDVYFGMGLTAGISAVMYYFRPEGCIKFFGGDANPTALMWTRVAAGGDAMVAYLCYHGLTSATPETKKLIVKSLGVFGLLHFSAFCLGHHLDGLEFPRGFLFNNWASVGVAAFTTFWWGYYRPPTNEEKKK